MSLAYLALACQMRWTGELSIIITLDWEKHIQVVKLSMTFESGPECKLTLFWAAYDLVFIQCVNTQILKLSIPVTHRVRTVNVADTILWCYSVGRELGELLLEPNLPPPPPPADHQTYLETRRMKFLCWVEPSQLLAAPADEDYMKLFLKRRN